MDRDAGEIRRAAGALLIAVCLAACGGFLTSKFTHDLRHAAGYDAVHVRDPGATEGSALRDAVDAASGSYDPPHAADAVQHDAAYQRRLAAQECTPRFIFKPDAVDPFHVDARRRDAGSPLTDEELNDTAIVTFASGDHAARMATALVQSLRDVGTRIPNILVMLVRGGYGSEWCADYYRKEARGRGSYWSCGKPEAVATEIVSPEYLAAWDRLDVRYKVLNPTPDRNYSGFRGNRAVWWGMAMSKLLVWSLTEYRKVIWMDGDTLVQHNIDHLLREPEFSAALTQECDIGGSGYKTSGGLWVLEPSTVTYNQILDFMDKPVPYSNNEGYRMGDMQVVGFFFGDQNPAHMTRGFPFIRDAKAGAAPRLDMFPEFRNWTHSQLVERYKEYPPELLKPYLRRGEWVEGMLPEFVRDGPKDRGHAIWKPLDPRYDGLVGNCRAMIEEGQGRCFGPDYYSVHFSCMPTLPHIKKPGSYENEYELMKAIKNRMHRCFRYFFLSWYDAYVRAMREPFPAPLWNGTVVTADDAEADTAFRATYEAERGK